MVVNFFGGGDRLVVGGDSVIGNCGSGSTGGRFPGSYDDLTT